LKKEAVEEKAHIDSAGYEALAKRIETAYERE